MATATQLPESSQAAQRPDRGRDLLYSGRTCSHHGAVAQHLDRGRPWRAHSRHPATPASVPPPRHYERDHRQCHSYSQCLELAFSPRCHFSFQPVSRAIRGPHQNPWKALVAIRSREGLAARRTVSTDWLSGPMPVQPLARALGMRTLPVAAGLRLSSGCAGLSMICVVAGRLSRSLGHVGALLGLPVIRSARQ